MGRKRLVSHFHSCHCLFHMDHKPNIPSSLEAVAAAASNVNIQVLKFLLTNSTVIDYK